MRFSSLPDSRALTALTLVACSSSLEVPPQSSIECSANRDCTEGLVCVTEAARCVLPTAQCIFFENDSAIAEPDGVACTLDDGSGGVCARGLCSPSTCGDGIVAASEECDDGAENGSASDRCRSNCRLPRCGDGIVDTGEECDDGNTNSEDGCIGPEGERTCVFNVCGDGVVNEAVEECDDGNLLSDDGCLPTCVLATCGDFLVDRSGDEECDDGNGNPNDGCASCRLNRWDASAIAGGGNSGGSARDFALVGVSAVAVSPSGRVFVADPARAQIFTLDPPNAEFPDGTASFLAGTAQSGSVTANSGLASEAVFTRIRDLAADGFGNLYVLNSSDIARIRPDRTIETLVQSRLGGAPPDDADLAAVGLSGSTSIATDTAGNLFIASDRLGVGAVYMVAASTERIYQIAGGGGTAAFPVKASEADLDDIRGIAVGAQALWLIVRDPDSLPDEIVVRMSLGALAGRDTDEALRDDALDDTMMEIVAGGGDDWPPTDLTSATDLRLPSPQDLAVAPGGTLYVSVSGQAGAPAEPVETVLRVGPSGNVSRLGAGDAPGFAGDGQSVATARYRRPESLAIDSRDRLLIADTLNHRIRRIEGAQITSIVGDVLAPGLPDPIDARSYITRAQSVAVDPQRRVVLCDEEGHVLVRFTPGENVERIAGLGLSASSGNGGLAIDAGFERCSAVAVSPDGEIWVADTTRSATTTKCIRRIDASGVLTDVVGDCATAQSASSGDGGPAADATFTNVRDLAFLDDGSLLIAEASCVRQVFATAGLVDTGSNIDRVAGDCATAGAGGNGGLRLKHFSTMWWRSRSTGPDGSLYPTPETRSSASSSPAATSCCWPTTRAPSMTVLQPRALADGDPGMARLRGLAVDEVARVLYIADTGNHAIRRVDLDTIALEVTTVAGSPIQVGFAGDDGPAVDASLFAPEAVAVLPANGSLYIADTANHRLRVVMPTGVISTIMGTGVPASGVSGPAARQLALDSPRGVATDTFGNVFVTSRRSIVRIDSGVDGIATGQDGAETIFGLLREGYPENITDCLGGLAVADSSAGRQDRVVAVDFCVGAAIELRR